MFKVDVSLLDYINISNWHLCEIISTTTPNSSRSDLGQLDIRTKSSGQEWRVAHDSYIFLPSVGNYVPGRYQETARW